MAGGKDKKKKKKGKGRATTIDLPDRDESVKVVVRCRPMASDEEERGCERAVDMDSTMGQVSLWKPGVNRNAHEAKQFTFDLIYDWNSTQLRIYEETARPLVDSVLEGFNGTIFAYGQTGTGKTFTMEGVYEDPDLRGIIPNAFNHIFETIGMGNESREYLVRASYLEIYNEEVRDLLSKNFKQKLQLKENPESGIYVKGLSAFVVKNVAEIDKVMSAGKKNRATGKTKMNERSSRSHSIFTITVECSEIGPDGEQHIRVGKLNLVDLAGSERQTKTGAEGDRLKEAIKINQSLSALGNVISALVDGKSTHVPYRDSKLTRLLQDSLGGNSKTIMIANIGPADYNYDETISTLRYANRAKNIKNKPRINEDPKDAMLRQFQEEIERLRAQLAAAGVTDFDPAAMASAQAAGGGNAIGFSEAMIQEMEERIAKEREELMAQRELADEDRHRMEAELEQRAAEVEEERRKREEVAQRLAQMEEKVIVGGTNYIDLSEQQARQLEQNRIEMERRHREEERLRIQLEKQQEEEALLKEDFRSLEEAVETKTKKLKKLWSKFQAAKTEIADLEEEHAQAIADLNEDLRQQRRDIQLFRIIIENFIPPEEVDRIRSRCIWDDELGDYRLQHLQHAGNNIERIRRPTAANTRRPVSEFANVNVQYGSNLGRFKPENILQLELDMPERTTVDYTGPGGDPNLDAAFNDALAEGGDLELSAAETLPNVYLTYDDDIDVGGSGYRGGGGGGGGVRDSNSRTRKSGRAGSSRAASSRRGKRKASRGSDAGAAAADTASQYPQSRGYVVGS